MPDIQELADGDMAVAQKIAGLPDHILFGEGQDDDKAGRERSDDPEAPNEIQDGPETAKAGDDQGEGEQEATAETPDDQEFEIPDPDGGEAQKVTLSELVEAHREFTAFNQEKAAILTRVQAEATQEAQGMVQQTRQSMTQIGHHLQAVLQHIQPPQPPVPPSMDVVNPNSMNYDPDAGARYAIQKAHYDQAIGRFQFINQAAQGIAQQQREFDAQRDEREFKALAPHWPEFTDPVKGQAVQQTFVEGMNQHYKFSPQELDAVLVDHRQALVARDALKWREHVAKEGKAKATLKDKVVAKAPAKVASSGSQRGKSLTTEQSNHMNARKALIGSGGKDMNAAAKGMLRFL
jgi:hypothetical protein